MEPGKGISFINTKGVKLTEEEIAAAIAKAAADAREAALASMPDVSSFEAKIGELNGFLAERDTTIGTLNTDLSAAKAANYDLIINGTPIPTTSNFEEEVITNNGVDFDDLFESRN